MERWHNLPVVWWEPGLKLKIDSRTGDPDATSKGVPGSPTLGEKNLWTSAGPPRYWPLMPTEGVCCLSATPPEMQPTLQQMPGTGSRQLRGHRAASHAGLHGSLLPSSTRLCLKSESRAPGTWLPRTASLRRQTEPTNNEAGPGRPGGLRTPESLYLAEGFRNGAENARAASRFLSLRF